MTVSAQQVLDDLMRVLGDIDELVKAAAAAPAEGKGAAPDPLLDRKVAAIRARIDGVKDLIGQKVHQRVEAVDHYFRDNTWKTVGTAAAVAFVVGFVLGRPRFVRHRTED
jgi:ElaB/YqjD/DUF883 family membrane-anchored ribosome-binding protein